jgi:predicted AAA+ superfamily ATPase
MYIIKMVSPYEANTKKTIRKMKKVYFLDLGIRNVIIQNFNSLDVRCDSDALFENFVFLEILKSIKSYYTVNFFRTRDGAEVDFIINDMRKKTSVEAKYKKLEKPVYLKALNNFNEREGISHSYVINLQLNSTAGNVRYLPAYLISKAFADV